MLYANIDFNWKLLQSVLTQSFIIITYRSTNTTNVELLPPVTENQTVNENRTVDTSTRRFAIVACSIHSSVEAYAFYTPIIAASWKRVGYETIVIFTGDFSQPNSLTARMNTSRSYLKRLGAHIIDVQCPSAYAVKISQLVRVFAGFLPDSLVHDNDSILSSDSDLMPLKFNEYQPTAGTDGFIYNAFCCGSFQRRNKLYRMFPSESNYGRTKDVLRPLIGCQTR